MHIFRKRCIHCGCEPFKHEGFGKRLPHDWRHVTENIGMDGNGVDWNEVEGMRRDERLKKRFAFRQEMHEADLDGASLDPSLPRIEQAKLMNKQDEVALAFLKDLTADIDFDDDIMLFEVQNFVNQLPEEARPVKGNNQIDRIRSKQCPVYDMALEFCASMCPNGRWNKYPCSRLPTILFSIGLFSGKLGPRPGGFQPVSEGKI